MDTVKSRMGRIAFMLINWWLKVGIYVRGIIWI